MKPMDRFILLIATGFGAGRLPKAPGTFGSLVGLLVAWPLLAHGLALQALAIAVVAVIGVAAADRAAILLAQEDPGEIVIDEILGIMITLFAVPPEPVWVLLGFGLFRLFDIAKPPPCRWAERAFRGGAGIMADDVLAGIYAGGIMHLFMVFR